VFFALNLHSLSSRTLNSFANEERPTAKTATVNRVTIVVCTLLLIGLAQIWTASVTAATQYTTGKVGEILVLPNGDILFYLEGMPQLCQIPAGGNDAKPWIVVTSTPTPDNKPYATSDGKKELLTILMSAKLAGRSVTVRSNNNFTQGEWGCHLEGVSF
jgi:hypothetical protein